METAGQDESGRDPATDEPAARLAAAVADLVDRVRPLPSSRLLGCPPELDGRTRAVAIHALAQALADLAAGLEPRSPGAPTVWRALPDLGPFVVGDQLAVTGADVVAAVGAALAPAAVCRPDGTYVDLDAVLTQCLAAVAQLRTCI